MEPTPIPSVPEIVEALTVYEDYQPDADALLAAAQRVVELAEAFAPPEQLHAAIAALGDATKRKQVNYLRLTPLETPVFPHGLSLAVGLKPGDRENHQRARQVVAEYLYDWLRGHNPVAYALNYVDDVWSSPEDLEGDFYQVRVTANRSLTHAEAQRLFACIGYAFRQHLRGESLGEPQRTAGNQWIAPYDITKSASDDWGARLPDALAAARLYAVEGTPQRKTQRNTRLVEGLGEIALHFEFA